MIYEHYFALNQRPFSIAPNPNFLYACDQYKEALAALEYGMLHRGGFVLLTGEVGTGKTTLCKFLLQSIPQDTEVALILHPQLDRLELLQLICKEFGVTTNEGDKESLLIERLTEFLLGVYSKGGYSVLVIDEAQHLDESVLELVRLLTNLETHEDKLLQIILLGQPELRERLNHYQLRQLNQRFTARYHLRSLSFLQEKAYLDHRIEVAGGSDSLFSLPAVWLLHRLTKGIPRLINVLADRCLMGCYAEQKKQVSALMVLKASKEVLPATKRSPWFSPPAFMAMVFFAVVVSGFGFMDIAKIDVLSQFYETSAQTSLKLASAQQKQVEKQADQKSPCHQIVDCWSGRLPYSVVNQSNMQGYVYVSGQWQVYQGQSLYGDQISVAMTNVEDKFKNNLIKPQEENPLIPWVRDVLLSDNQSDNLEDVSQWQIISPESNTNQSTFYDVILHDLVKAFQRKHGLLVDGVLGPQTLISLSLWDQKMQMAAH